jgi:hypothetical protein
MGVRCVVANRLGSASPCVSATHPRSDRCGCFAVPSLVVTGEVVIADPPVFAAFALDHPVPVLCGHGSVEPRMFVPARHTELQLGRRANAANLSLGMEPGCQRTAFGVRAREAVGLSNRVACGFQSACPASRGKARDLCHSVMAKSLRRPVDISLN